MIIYGGIFEVTKELNDMHVFDLKNERWLCLFEELNSPKKGYGVGNMAGSYNKTPSMNKDVDRRSTMIMSGSLNK